MDTTPNSQPTNEQSLNTQEPLVGNSEKKSSTGKKLTLGLGGFVLVLLVAGTTYGALVMFVPKKTASVATKSTTKVADTASGIDSTVQSYVAAEQKLDDQLSSMESQTVTEDANTSQSLEGNYANF